MTKAQSAAKVNEEFETLLEVHKRILNWAARAYARGARDQLLLIHEIRFQLWQSFRNYQEDKSASTWFRRIILSTAISWGGKPKKREWQNISEEGTATAHQKDIRLLFDLFDGLDPFNRALLLLYLDDLTDLEISNVMGITPAIAATKITALRSSFAEWAANREADPREVELDDLRTTWQSASGCPDETNGSQASSLWCRLSYNTRQIWPHLWRESMVRLIIGPVVLLWSGRYLPQAAGATEWWVLLAFAPSLALFLTAIYLTVQGAKWLVYISATSYSEPVVKTSKRVLTLNYWRAQSNQTLLLAGVPLSLLFPLFVLQQVSGLYAGFYFYGLWPGAMLLGGIALTLFLAIGAMCRIFTDPEGTFAVTKAEKSLEALGRFCQK